MLDSFYRAFVAEQRYLLYLDGLKVTILVSVIAILIGVALGTILALMRLTAEQKGKSTLLSKIAYVYIDIIRGTPTLTQLMIMYFVILKGQNGLLVGSLTFGTVQLMLLRSSVQEFRRLIRDRWKVDVLLDYPMYRQ